MLPYSPDGLSALRYYIELTHFCLKAPTMTDHWESFLKSQGAHRNEQGVSHFADAGSSPANANLFALEHLGYLLVEGPEAEKFLQGQVTCDVNLVTEDHSQPGAHCNTKGRMMFSFRAVHLPPESEGTQSIALIMHRGLLEKAQQALAKYAVFSKADVSLGEDCRILGLSGAQSPALASELLPRLPIAPHDVVSTETALCLRVSGDRFLCLIKSEAAQQLWESWAPQCRLEGYEGWNLANIRDGFGEIVPGTEEMFIPQMLNMQITGGVSFNKGCYVGQEVVARMQYLGKLKRHMRHAKVSTTEAPPPGSPLYSSESGQSVGNVVLAAPDEKDGSELLAVTTDSAFESDALYLDSQRSEKLQLLSLPYAIT